MSEASWRRRFRAPVVMFPTWARDNPDRLLYLSNAGGKFEAYVWDKRTGKKRPGSGIGLSRARMMTRNGHAAQ